MNALIYQSTHKRRFAAALGAAVIIHVAVIGFATAKEELPPTASGPIGDPILELEPATPIVDPPQLDQSDPLPTPPPQTHEDFPESNPTPPPVKRTSIKPVVPLVRGHNSAPGQVNLSSARV